MSIPVKLTIVGVKGAENTNPYAHAINFWAAQLKSSPSNERL